MTNKQQPKDVKLAPCRLCGHPVKPKPWVLGQKDMTIVTCENPNCAAHDFTYTLAKYMKKQQ